MNALPLPPLGAVALGLGLGLVALALRGLALRRSRSDRRRLLDRSLYERLVAPPPRIQGPLRALLFALGVGVAGAVLGGAGRGDGDRGASVAGGGPEFVLTLDASNSMLARDTPPSRLERQRSLARTVAERVEGAIGVVYFSGGGYVLAPLTPDRAAVRMQVEAVRPAHVGRGGSALAEGLGQALDVLAGGEEGSRRTVIIFSDGEETVERPVDELLERAREEGVTIHTVGIGTEEGGPIPLSEDALLPLEAGMSETGSGGGTSGAPEPGGGEGDAEFLRGPDGEVVTTRLNEAPLRRIAEETGGRYVPGDPEGIEDLLDHLAGEGGSGSGAPGRASLLLLLAFGLLWVEGFLFRSG